MVRVYFYLQTSSSQWLYRIDANSPLLLSEAQSHAEEEYALPGDVAAHEFEMDQLTLQALRDATGWSSDLPPVPGGGVFVTPPFRSPSRRDVLLQKFANDPTAGSGDRVTLRDVVELIRLERGL